MTQEYQLAQEKLLVFYHELETLHIFLSSSDDLAIVFKILYVSKLLLLLVGPNMQFCLF
jgi:hypothetical protein